MFRVLCIAVYIAFSTAAAQNASPTASATCAQIAGRLTNLRGGPVADGRVTIALFDASARLVWQSSPMPVNPADGSFEFKQDVLPQIPGVVAATLGGEARKHAASKVDLRVQADAAGRTIYAPCRVELHLEGANPWLTLFILIPGIFGLTLAVVHTTPYCLSRDWTTIAFAIGAAVLWSVVASIITVLYVLNGDTLMPLFWPDLLVSSGAIVAAYVGSFIYVAYSLMDKDEGFFSNAPPAVRRKLMRTLGGRIYVAPYIALAAYVLFSSNFPTLRTGPYALFFGLFAGLYIKPVLDALNGIGMRFLSPEATRRVAERGLRTEAPEIPAAPSAKPRMAPEQGLIDAVKQARGELLRLPDVIGVAPAAKSDTKEPAIRIWVIAQNAVVPPTLNGFPTEALVLPPPSERDRCRHVASQISWENVARDARKARRGVAAATSVRFSRHHGLGVLTDSQQTLFTAQKEFNIVEAYTAVKPAIGDNFDFVAFLIDTKSGMPRVADYHVAVFSDVNGTMYTAEGNPGAAAKRAEWGSEKLRACQVHSHSPLNCWYFLHELGHYWSAYVRYRKADQQAPRFDLLMGDSDQGLYHWGRRFDDGRSPMDYDEIEWKPSPGGLFSGQTIGEQDLRYCPLDLYLMGLIPASAVGPLRIMRDTETAGNTGVPVRELDFEISIEDVIRECGPREPACGGASAKTTYRQAFVVVTADPASNPFLDEAESKRRQVAQLFHEATDKKAQLITDLS